jgi:hypothetical protein
MFFFVPERVTCGNGEHRSRLAVICPALPGAGGKSCRVCCDCGLVAQDHEATQAVRRRRIVRGTDGHALCNVSGAGRQGAAEALRLLQKLHADRKETEVQLRKDSDQATINPNMEEMLEDVKHPRALQKEGMNKQTGAEPPRTAGVPNTRGYQEDQPLDAASATCCALLRPFSQERQPGSRPRRRTRHATNPHPPKR